MDFQVGCGPGSSRQRMYMFIAEGSAEECMLVWATQKLGLDPQVIREANCHICFLSSSVTWALTRLVYLAKTSSTSLMSTRFQELELAAYKVY